MGENTRKDRRTKVLSMTVRYRSATLGEFIEHHSYDVSRGGMFIKTPSPFPPGTLLKFEVKIADEQRVMQGVGRVVWKRDLDGNTPNDPAGMGIKFIKIDDASRAVIDKLVEGRAPGQDGAFEHLPEARTRMFPSTPPPVPAPEDHTVIKPATELLMDALKKTGEESGEPVELGRLSSDSNSAAQKLEAKKSSDKSGTRESSHLERKSNAVVRKDSDKKSRSSQAKVRESQVRPTSAHEEEGRGRAFVSILVAVAVAAGIYFVTKQGTTKKVQEQPEPEPVTQPLPQEVAPDVPEVVPPPETTTAESIGVLAPDESNSVVLPILPETVDEPIAPKPPAPKPPAPKPPAPKPLPVPKPTPPPAPAPTPAPTPATSSTPPVTPAPLPSTAATPVVPAASSSSSGD